MYFSDLMRGLLRRWYVLLIGFALAAGGAYLVFDAVPVRYEANATMMLLPPDENVALQEGSNPYLVLGGMGQALAILTTRLNSQVIQEELASETLEYGVSGDTTSGAAFLLITTQADSEQNALALLDDVQLAADAQLTAMQAELEVTEVASIRMMSVTSDIKATALSSTRMQLTLAVAGVGVVLTFIVAAAIEGLSASRARRRVAKEAKPSRERGPLEPLRASDIIEDDAPAPRGRHKRRTPPREASTSEARVSEARVSESPDSEMRDGSAAPADDSVR